MQRENTPPSTQEYDYTITVGGGREHGNFSIVPPLSDEHHVALKKEPLLTRAPDFYLERTEADDHYWKGHDYNNGSSWGEYYQRARSFANIVASVLQREGVSVSVITDGAFEHRTSARLQDIQSRNP